MKRILLLLSLFVVSITNAQNLSNSIVIGTIDSVYSKVLKEQRKIWVSVPNSDPNNIFSKQNYPVVYLLDGDAHFYSVMGMIQQLSEVNGNTVYPQMIVVGIPNTDRMRDLTPTHSVTSPFGGGDFDKTSGGGENFTSFIEKELIPHIDSLYPTAPYRVFIGHSLGGLMVINTLINHPQLFNSYIAIDPSMWWDDQKLLKKASAGLSGKNYKDKSLFLAVANTMKTGMDTLLVKKDTGSATIHIRSNLQLANILKNMQSNGLHWAYKYYNEDDHGSVPLIAEYDAMHFLFSKYKMPSFENLFDSSFNADSAITAHFKNVSRQMGYKILPPESVINSLGYAFMQNNMPGKAYTFFKMNVDNYPTSFNTYDSMGDFYESKGEKNKAIEYFSKALSLKDNPDTRQKLEKLKISK
ncbi:MAG TPA: alpha/beta hydrolase-fold protein [Ferruginibacter sp.]|nr:alpha/beta hydrolase-fold protein [Ferruginibacter sp.]